MKFTSPDGANGVLGFSQHYPSLVQQEPHSAEQASIPGSSISSMPSFGHDFSRMQVHSAVPATIQTKLTVNQPGDQYEQEADQVAEQVMRMPELESERKEGFSSFPQDFHIQRMPPQANEVRRQPEEEKEEIGSEPMEEESSGKSIEGEEKEESLQAKESPGHTPTVTPELHARINSLRGGGQPLDAVTRAFMEPRFGFDFSQMRIHTDERAAETARGVNALAYTVGRDVVFGAGQYAPKTSEGRRLLAHELTHVVQQWNSFPVLQKNDDKGKSTKTSEWTELVSRAIAALKRNDKENAEKLYRDAIFIAAKSVGVPPELARLVRHEVVPQDIKIKLDLSKPEGERHPREIVAGAKTAWEEIPNDRGNEENYWRWIYFGPEALGETQAFTEAVIYHELTHAAQNLILWNKYKADTDREHISRNENSWVVFSERFKGKIAAEEYEFGIPKGQQITRLEGPYEFKAYITYLKFLGRLSAKEQEIAVSNVFDKYFTTALYISFGGELGDENLVMTTAAAIPMILDTFRNANRELKGLMGRVFWEQLRHRPSNLSQVQSFFSDLKDLATWSYENSLSSRDKRLSDDYLKRVYKTTYEDLKKR